MSHTLCLATMRSQCSMDAGCEELYLRWRASWPTLCSNTSCWASPTLQLPFARCLALKSTRDWGCCSTTLIRSTDAIIRAKPAEASMCLPPASSHECSGVRHSHRLKRWHAWWWLGFWYPIGIWLCVQSSQIPRRQQKLKLSRLSRQLRQ